MTTAAQRMRELRRRRAGGLVQMTATVQIDRLTLALVADQFLQEWDDQNPAAITAAFQRMVETYIVAMVGPDVTASPG